MNLLATIMVNTSAGLPVRLRIVDHDADDEDRVFMNTSVHTVNDAIKMVDLVRDSSGQTVTVENTLT